MYLSQSINVNLTQENADILKKPSKVFNKIKALFSGGMTPTEQRQATVMLSVLQRLNIALRKAKFDQLVSISANDKLLYESNNKTDADLDEGNMALTNSFESGDITQVNSLALTVDAEIGHLRFLIRVMINRKPRSNSSPIVIDLYGFINEFKRQPHESEQALGLRVKQLIEHAWGDKQQRDAKLSLLELEFRDQVKKLQYEINMLFPAQSDTDTLQRRVRKGKFMSKHGYHTNRYEDCYAYIPFYYLYDTSDAIGDPGFILDETTVWDDDVIYNDNDNKSDASAAGFWSGDADSSSSDGGSSCGSSCGGGCGS
jgi:hypothetical protein